MIVGNKPQRDAILFGELLEPMAALSKRSCFPIMESRHSQYSASELKGCSGVAIVTDRSNHSFAQASTAENVGFDEYAGELNAVKTQESLYGELTSAVS